MHSSGVEVVPGERFMHGIETLGVEQYATERKQ